MWHFVAHIRHFSGTYKALSWHIQSTFFSLAGDNAECSAAGAATRAAI